MNYAYNFATKIAMGLSCRISVSPWTSSIPVGKKLVKIETRSSFTNPSTWKAQYVVCVTYTQKNTCMILYPDVSIAGLWERKVIQIHIVLHCLSTVELPIFFFACCSSTYFCPHTHKKRSIQRDFFKTEKKNKHEEFRFFSPPSFNAKRAEKTIKGTSREFQSNSLCQTQVEGRKMKANKI